MDPWRVSRQEVADSQNFDEEQDPETDTHFSVKLDPDPH
jgi:hypothetical protein